MFEVNAIHRTESLFSGVESTQPIKRGRSKKPTTLQVKYSDTDNLMSSVNDNEFLQYWALNQLKFLSSNGQSILSQFIKLKEEKAPLIECFELISQTSPKAIGEKEWITALISLLYDNNETKGELAHKIILLLKPSLQHQDFFYILSILRAILKKSDTLNAESKTLLIPILEKEGLTSHPNIQIRNTVHSLLVVLKGGRIEHISSPIVEQTENPENSTPSLHVSTELSIYIPPFITQQFKKILVLRLLMYYCFADQVVKLEPHTTYDFFNIQIKDRVKEVDDFYNRIQKHEIAIIVHPSAVMLPHWNEAEDIIVMQNNPVFPIRTLHHAYEYFLNKGYSEIYVFVPDKTLWPSYRFAKQAAMHMEQRIKIIDSKTFGMGLSVVADEFYKQKNNPVNHSKIDNIVSNILDKVFYWEVIHKVTAIRKEPWFKQLQENYGKKLPLKHHPIISLANKFEIVEDEANYENVFLKLEKLTKSVVTKHKKQVESIRVAYYHAHAEAIKMAHHIKKNFPKIDVTIELSHSNLNDRLGTHLSVVCLVK